MPATTNTLVTLAARGLLGPAPLTAFAVTPGLREWYLDDDIEALEYAALLEAARASLRLIGAGTDVLARRVVIAADVDTSAVVVRDDLDRGVVRVDLVVPMSSCASIHVDDADAESTVALAAVRVDAADVGDPEAEAVVDDADGYELSWYATQELELLLVELGLNAPD